MAEQALASIQALYAIEQQAQELSPEQRRQLRARRLQKMGSVDMYDCLPRVSLWSSRDAIP